MNPTHEVRREASSHRRVKTHLRWPVGAECPTTGETWEMVAPSGARLTVRVVAMRRHRPDPGTPGGMMADAVVALSHATGVTV